MRGLMHLSAFFFIVLCFAGVTSAAGCANGDQIIMRLSASDNAHGAIWDQAYGIKICYDDLFGTTFGQMNAHACSNGSTVVKLYSATNAHASSPDSQNYQISVCHRGLKNCAIRYGEGCAKSEEKAIVYLSNTSNAHLSRSYIKGFYEYAVCCEGSSAPNPPAGINYCSDYTSPTVCNNDEYGVSVNRCPAGKVCYCMWNATGNACVQAYNNQVAECSYKCSLSANYASGICDEQGFMFVDIKATRVDLAGNCASVMDSDCQSRRANVPCGLFEIELPFFGLWQAAISALCITISYLLFSRRKFFKE